MSSIKPDEAKMYIQRFRIEMEPVHYAVSSGMYLLNDSRTQSGEMPDARFTQVRISIEVLGSKGAEKFGFAEVWRPDDMISMYDLLFDRAKECLRDAIERHRRAAANEEGKP